MLCAVPRVPLNHINKEVRRVEDFLGSRATSTMKIMEEIFTPRKIKYMKKQCQNTITEFLTPLCFRPK